jgi:hypothetical protein
MQGERRDSAAVSGQGDGIPNLISSCSYGLFGELVKTRFNILRLFAASKAVFLIVGSPRECRPVAFRHIDPTFEGKSRGFAG